MAANLWRGLETLNPKPPQALDLKRFLAELKPCYTSELREELRKLAPRVKASRELCG